MGPLALLLWCGTARGDEPPPPPPPATIGAEKRPLAIPGGPPQASGRPGGPPHASGPPQSSGPPDRPPPYDAAYAKALRDYRARYLSLRPRSEIVVGTNWTYGMGGTWSSYGGAGFGGYVSSPMPYVEQNDSMAVFQGTRRLDMPSTFVALGDPEGAAKLNRRIRSNKNGATFLYAIGFAGIASSIGGLLAADQAETYEERQKWVYVSWAGVGATVFGFVGGSLPSARAHRLQTDPTATFTLPELQERIDRSNDALAAELGLSPMQAVGLEAH
jgi:hypothetical protein